MFRTTALAAALAVASFGAAASPIEINFDSLGVENNSSGVPVAGPFTDQNVTVSGAYAYAPLMLDELENDPIIGDPTSGVGAATSGFIANRGRATTPGPITIELGSIYTNDSRYFKSVTMGMWSPATITIEWFKKDNSNSNFVSVGSKNLTAGGLNQPFQLILTPSTGETSWDQSAVERLSISAGVGVLAIDNLSIDLTGSSTPNPAPEPASYALVGLALLAASAASRRRA